MSSLNYLWVQHRSPEQLAALEASFEALRGEPREFDEPEPETRTTTGREALLGTSFRLGAGRNEDGTATEWTGWGHFAQGSFSATVDNVAMDGDVTTGFLGADARAGRLTAGAALALTRGDGTFRPTGGAGAPGTVNAKLTALHPYARLELNERLSGWAIAGLGTGTLDLTEETPVGPRRHRTDIGLRMGALGARGELLTPDEAEGLGLAIRTDALWVQTTSDATEGLVATKSDATRLRVLLDGARPFTLGAGRTLAPRAELGLRHDAGDAETGAGVEAGVGLTYEQPGFSLEAGARTLLAHGDNDYRAWTAHAALRVAPGASGRGLAFSVTPTFGPGTGGREALWSPAHAGDLAPDTAPEATTRLNAELSYGLSGPRGLGLLSPYAALSLAEGAERTWRAGVRWSAAPGASLGLEATRSEPADDTDPRNALTVTAAVRF